MKNSALELFIRSVIAEAYSTGLISTLKKKWRAEAPELTDQQIEFYIDVFDRNKNSAPVQRAKGPDVTKYSWSEIESLIDANFSTRSAHETQIEGDLKPVYTSPDGTLQIFLGDRREKCVKLRQDFEGRSGKQYSWCIARSDASNMFSWHRFKEEEPVFYYIFDAERDRSDPLHACIIYVDSGGTYTLSDAQNEGDKQYEWPQLVEMMPKLGPIKEVFKHIPLAPREREIYDKVGNELPDEEFFKLSRDLKEEYISFGHELTDAQLKNVFSLPGGAELINKYCNLQQNVFIPLEIYQKLPSATKRVIEKNFSPSKRELYEFWYLGKKEIKGSLNLFNVPITSLPPGLSVGGSLKLSGTEITSLPPDLSVGGELDLHYTKITSLPLGLNVRGNLNLSYSKIASLPSGLSVRGGLDLSGTRITSLPPDLSVGGNLFLRNMLITSLPSGLSVGGAIWLAGTKITSLPPDLVVKGPIFPSELQAMYDEMKKEKKLESLIRSLAAQIL